MESYSVEAVLSAVDNGFSSGIKNAADMINTLDKASSTSLGSLGQSVTSAGKSMTKGLTLPIAGVAAAAAKVGIDFQAQMSRVQAVSGATGTQLDSLKNQAIQLGAKTAFSAGEAADGMENLASAGMNSKQIMAAMPGVLDLAAVSGGNVAQSAEDMTTALNGFGLSASKSGHVADIFAKAAADTNAEAVDMGQAMTYVAPAAHAAGQSLENTAAAIGLLSDAGIKGSSAGTALGQVMEQLQGPSAQAKKAMEDIGFSAYDQSGKMKSLTSIVKDFGKATDGMTDKQKQYYLSTIFGVQGGRAMNVMLSQGADKLDDMTKSLKNSSGAADKMARIMQDNTKSGIEQLGGVLETTAILFEQKLDPAIRSVAQHIADLVGAFTKLPDGAQNAILIAIAFAALIGPLMIVAGKVLTFANNVKTAKAALGAMSKIKPMPSPIPEKTNGTLSKLNGIISNLTTGFLKVGGGILLAAAGFGILIGAVTMFSKTGNQGIAALVAVTIAIVALVAVFAALSSKLEAGAGGLIALGATMVLVATSVAILAAGIKTLAKTGTDGLAMVALLSAAFVAIIAVVGALGPRLTAGAAGMLALGVAMDLVAASVVIVASGIKTLTSTGKAGTTMLLGIGVAIAALITLFAVFGPALTASATGIATFGAAVLAMGLGIAVASVGIATLITAFTKLTMVSAQIVPTFTAIGTGFIAMMTIMLQGIVTNIPLITQAFIAMGQAILTTIVTLTPQIVQTVAQLLLSILTTIATYAPQYAMQVLNLLVNILGVLTTYTPVIVAQVVALLVAILGAIGANAPTIIAAFFAMIGQLAQAIVTQMPYIIQIFTALLAAMVAAAVTMIGTFNKLGGVLMDALKAGITGKKFDAGEAVSGVMKGAADSASKSASTAFDNMGGNSAIKALQGIAKKGTDANAAGTKLMGNAVKGMDSKKGEAKTSGTSVASNGVSGLNSQSSQANSAGANMGLGFNNGLESTRDTIMGTASSIASQAAATIKKGLDEHSPSKITYGFGVYFGQGFINGIASTIRDTGLVATKLANAATGSNAFNDVVSGLNGRLRHGQTYSATVTAGGSTMEQQNNALLQAIANKDSNVYLDGDTLVGGTMDRYNAGLGKQVSREGRWHI